MRPLLAACRSAALPLGRPIFCGFIHSSNPIDLNSSSEIDCFASGLIVRKLSDDTMIDRFGIIFEMFTPKRYFWNFTVLLRRAIVIGVFVAMAEEPQERYMFVTLLNVLILMTHVLARPFSDMLSNACESISLCILTVISRK